MDGSNLPRNAFIDPRGNNRREVERFARSVFDLVLDLLAGAAGRPTGWARIDRFRSSLPC